MDAISIIQEIGSTLGVPATIFLTILWMKVRKNEEDIKEVKNESALLKQTLSDIKSDVSYLRGVFEGKEKD